MMKEKQGWQAPELKDGADNPYYGIVTPITKPEVLKHAVSFDADTVRAAWQASPMSHLQLISTNKRYRGLPQQVWNAILAQHETLHPYEADYFDCDAFSAVFVGFTLWHFEVNGVVRVFDNSGSHSYNAVLVASNDGESCVWKGVEPQADVFVRDKAQHVVVTAPKGIYAAQSGFAITA